jgi:hypothetical protein
MTNLDLAYSYLGAEIEYKLEGIFVHQNGCIKKLLDKFSL